MEVNSVGLRYLTIMGLLILSALLLAGRLGYLYLADAERFPITTIKVAATYEHITHKELENVLAKYLDASFFLLSVKGLQSELNSISWIDTAYVERVWPDTLKIKLTEKKPVAIWGDALMTRDGKLFNQGSVPSDLDIPKLKGPQSQQLEVLQVYEKLSKILSSYGLNASGLYLRDNQSWVLLLNHNVKIYLGKKELEERLLRFCKAYPAVFAEKADQLAGVDLRYPRGMAVQWKQQMGR
ncbi:TPA: FtsQ-type POTRA domain-containing protein [Legionella pneumophila]|uniref:Cell division protein FtsQ n=1 Tax=Legionella pneumophila TaxID=446 RepID=A0AAN5KRV5_LEGPN|nr:cell division protein FtsQ/DivIB [Legionella pneumophila subsp. fraseri]HAT1596751.1 FtsQ-type POTRA domain-containing protein [Legionella pneumophila]MDX1845901.1 cell division protein FtsQ/DivIB [Legionella pneumophila subsp. fraseri]HAT1771423.1 FtsQ-type POTRA domain-containing protein [Legionella pneumophila]HAT1971420.1 FtsQ-type POTRA domain-containing protein [Legionella pneumophila]